MNVRKYRLSDIVAIYYRALGRAAILAHPGGPGLAACDNQDVERLSRLAGLAPMGGHILDVLAGRDVALELGLGCGAKTRGIGAARALGTKGLQSLVGISRCCACW
jgi:hypothetical protein